MKIKSSKIFLIILSCLSLVSLGVLLFGAYIIRGKNQKISEQLNSVDQVTQMEDLARSVKAIQEESKDDLTALDSFALSSDELATLIDNIETAGRALGVSVTILSVDGPDKKSSSPSKVNITIEAQGSWSGVFSFLQAIENLPHLVMTQDVNLTKREAAWHLNMAITLDLFN